MQPLSENIYLNLAIVHPSKRRERLNAYMQTLPSLGLSCDGCSGECCSEFHNSMQVTTLELLDIFVFLTQENRLTDDLFLELQCCVDRYRLDKEIALKRNSFFRRTYRCPFYLGFERGCSISRKYKPYGCLAYNKSVNGCLSDQVALTQIGDATGLDEERCAKYFNKIGATITVKSPLPLAMVNLWKVFAKPS